MDETTTRSTEEILAERLKQDSPIPADCTDDELACADFSRRDVLIGTVRNDAQFDHALASLSYYAPVKAISPQDLPVRMIALYEEGLSRRDGIKRYGEITDTRVVRRDEIAVPLSRTNQAEAYYLFTVRSWEYLEHPIALIGTSRGKPSFTTEFLLTHARRSYQLVCVHSPADFRLLQVICELCAKAEKQAVPQFRSIDENHILSVAEGMLSLIHARGEVRFRCFLRAMETEPAEVINRLSHLLGFR